MFMNLGWGRRASVRLLACALMLQGCGGDGRSNAAPPTVEVTTADIERSARQSITAAAPVARKVIAGCRTGRYGCAATDQEYWLTDRSGSVFYLVFKRSDIRSGGRVYIYAPKTTGRQFFFVMRLSSQRVLTARVGEHGPIKFRRAPG